MYLEHEFLDEEEANAFLSTLPVGADDTKEEIREVTDQLLVMVRVMTCHCLLRLNYLNIFIHSPSHKNELLSGSKVISRYKKTQILAAIVGAAGCGKSYVMGAIVTYLQKCSLVVTKLAPNGVAASLIKGTTIHNFFKLDITGNSSLENGTVDAVLIKKLMSLL